MDPATSVWPRRMTVARGFARHMAGIDPGTEVPPFGLIPSRQRWRPPFIYSPADLGALMAEARAIRWRLTPPPTRPSSDCWQPRACGSGKRSSWTGATSIGAKASCWSESRSSARPGKFRCCPHPGRSRPLRRGARRTLQATHCGQLLRLRPGHQGDLRGCATGLQAPLRQRAGSATTPTSSAADP